MKGRVFSSEINVSLLRRGFLNKLGVGLRAEIRSNGNQYVAGFQHEMSVVT